jgi:BASS family bile acid:Na+ symporter
LSAATTPSPLPAWVRWAQDGFVLWVMLGAAWGYAAPEAAGAGRDWIPEALAVVMLGMGLTLRPEDLRGLRRAGKGVAVGVGLQYLVMPLSALLMAEILGLAPELAVGLVLVGAAPGGTASNVVAYLARGDVALSVAMTTASTLLSPLLTPLWAGVLASAWLPVDPLPLMVTVAEVVLLPVAVGIAVRRFWTPGPWFLQGVLPLVSMGAIAWIVGVITGLNHDRLAVAPTVLVAVVGLNGLGLGLGYWGARRMGLPLAARRTVSLEVGMQNSGLAVALAVAHFGPLAAVPGALFSIWHNLSGPALASVWRRSGA